MADNPSPTPQEDDIRRALSAVVDPSTGRDIVTTGMVSDLAIQGGRVAFAIQVDPRRGAALEDLRLAAERAAGEVPGVETVTAVLTAERAAGASSSRGSAASGTASTRARSAPSQAARTPAAKGAGAGAESQPASGAHNQTAGGAGSGRGIQLPGVSALVAVGSGKGGVGKSSVAVNLAAALAAEGWRTGLLDCDIYGPSIPRMTGLTARPDLTAEDKLIPLTAHGLSIMSIGFMVEEETPMIWRGPMVQSAVTQMLRDVAWGTLDILIIDMPPGTGDAQLTLAQQVPLSGAVIVSTPQEVALADARKATAMFRRVAVPVLGLVENMSYFVCPHCGERTDIFAHGGAAQEAMRLGVGLLGEVPIMPEVRSSGDSGTPLVQAAPDSLLAETYRGMARSLMAGLDAQAARPAPTIRFV